MDRYYNWLCGFLYSDDHFSDGNYDVLFKNLHDTNFLFDLAMDKNREDDGIGMRFRYGYEHNISSESIRRHFLDKPCSVLEMMVALSVRCEEEIMMDPSKGDRTGYWFWNMIVSLGLSGMNNDHFDVYKFNSIIDTFLNREYHPNGKGSLFKLKHPPQDLRSVEIWYQMNYWLCEFTKGDY